MSDQIVATTSDRIGSIRINRPEKKNALTQEMYAALADALVAAEADAEVRVILISGTDTVFSAGNDIADFISNFTMEEQSPVVRFLRTLAGASKPVVAAVNGPAIGIGTTMLLHCDLVWCGRTARFQLPFVNLGLVPEAASSLILPQMLGHRRAAALLLLGEAFDAETALQSGIVNGVVDDDRVMESALASARMLAAKPPAALRLSKQLLKRWTRDQVREVMDAEARIFAEQLRSPEASEAVQAFLERRAPDFSKFV